MTDSEATATQSPVVEEARTVAVPRCLAERRIALRAEHITRHDALSSLAYRLGKCGYISDEERDLLFRQAEEEWDDAIHIAAPDDPLRSLCGSLGRNLADLPETQDSWGGCWTCMHKADALEPALGGEGTGAQPPDNGSDGPLANTSTTSDCVAVATEEVKS